MKVRRRTWIVGGVALLAIATFAALVAVAHLPLSADVLRRQVEASLSEQLDGKVEIDSMTLRLLPEVHMVGVGLSVQHKARTDVAPLFSMKRFTVHAGLLALVHGHISSVTVEGLAITIPPRPERTSEQEAQDLLESGERAVERAKRAAAAPHRPAGAMRQFVVDTLVADDAQLVVLSRNPLAYPKVWEMHQLRLRQVNLDQAMPFRAVITNGIPPGDIDAAGTFGPWNAVEPGDTPVAGTFALTDADLSVFKGISGMTSATGSYLGTLGTMRITGETDSPDFTILLANHPIPVKTKYRAVVDATSGNTLIEEVDATFFSTLLVAKGGIYDVKRTGGRLVKLDVAIDKGRLEDVMKLAINTPAAPMVGSLTLRATLELPPGIEELIDKLRLDGSFDIQNGRFTDAGVQQQVADLSQRASGKMKDAAIDPRRVTSNFKGTFKLNAGELRVPHVTFNVPGAIVDISGRFAMRPPQALAFGGNLYADAKVSQMTTGVKSLLLKVVDPIFRHDGRTVVPLKISGTRDEPSFGVDVGRVLGRGNN